MEKVLIPEGGTIPPLIKPRNSQSAKLPCSIFSPLPIYLKPNNATTYQPLRICSAASELTPLLISMKDSKEQVIQVPGGTKKARLANMTDISSPLNDKQVLLTVSKLSSGSSIPSVAGQPQVSHGVVTNARKAVSVGSRRAKTKNKVIHMQQQPVLIQAPGFNHPIIVRQNPMLGSSSAHKVLAVKQEPGITTHQMITVSSNSSLTSTTTTMARPITSPAMSSSSFMVLSNGTRLKVVGKPVPVRLDTNMKNITLSRSPLVMAIPSTSLSSTVATDANPSQNIQSTPSPKKLQAAADPPAYLNIQIKQEPTEISTTETVYVAGTDIKEEVGNAEKELEEAQQESKFLDIKIKEELKCEESELLASDEQLRKVLGVEEKDCKPNVSAKPKFYIRTAEGKLVAISPDEASALGLNYKDNVGENQKKLTKALRTLQENSTETLKEFVPNYNCLVSEYANPTEFVSRNVPSCLQQNAEVMKNLSGKLVEAKCYGKTLLKSNTSVIGEFTQDEQRFLRIEVETQEQVKDLCDVPITPLNMYRCPFCSKDFKTKDHIISHIRVHTGERPYPCDVCGKRYRQRIDIIRHMRIHTGEKPFTCAFCHASFNQKSNLRSHMRVHTGERPVQCRVCGKGFSRNTHLKQHLKLHTGEKPFQCSICFKQFRFKSGLQAHERIHSGLKPYACSKCGRTFTQIVGLIRHTRTHAVEKPYRCQSCGKSFNNCDSYKAHIEIHTSERPYACDLCEKTFTDRAALRCHRKKYHSNMLICMICLREDFKSRIELREHLRAHERENWQETPDGNLVPKLLQGSSNHFVSVDDTVGDLSECEESDEDRQRKESEEIQVEVDLGHDNPIDDDDDDDDDDVKQEDQTNVDSELKNAVKEEDNDVDSDMEERLEIEDKDPLA